VLVDRFLDSAIEIDVDALFDGEELFLGGVMEHIEEAGIHSGDSACVLPAMTLTEKSAAEILIATECACGVQGGGDLVPRSKSYWQLFFSKIDPVMSKSVPMAT
jgi:carbamoyl-phosphate synthase large subunit